MKEEIKMEENTILLFPDSRLRIVLINFGGMGDEILFFPVIQVLREHFPLARICTVVEPRCQEVMENNYLVDKVYTLDIKSRQELKDLINFLGQIRNEAPDIVISSGRSPMVSLLLFFIGSKYRIGYNASNLTFLLSHKVELNINQYAGKMLFDLVSPLGIHSDFPLPVFHIPSIAEEWAKAWLNQNGIEHEKGFITVHTGVSNLSKQKGMGKSWENEKWLELINKLSDDGYNIVLLGSNEEKEDVDWLVEKLKRKAVSACGQTADINQLAALLKLSTMLICVDSGPMHIAVATKTPLVAIFGPTDEQKVLPPRYLRFSAVRVNMDCRPCLFTTRKQTCDELACIKGLSVDSVYNAVKEHLFLARKENSVN